MPPGKVVAVPLTTVSHSQIPTDAIDIDFNNTPAFGHNLSGDITLGVTSATLFSPLLRS